MKEESIAAVPRHVAIIMDGNGRWAQKQGKERIFGHAGGVESVRACVKAALRNGVQYLTLYAFSTENWGRPHEEVDALMELLCQSIRNESAELQEQGVAVKILGQRQRMSASVQEHLGRIEQETAAGGKLTLILALSYSSYWEITEAVRLIARERVVGTLNEEDITPALVHDYLATAAWPDPDLVVRTGGEQRLSNFLLWQAAYAELYFTETYWPDFDQAEFDKAITEYARRDRRFGLVKNEVTTNCEDEK